MAGFKILWNIEGKGRSRETICHAIAVLQTRDYGGSGQGSNGGPGLGESHFPFSMPWEKKMKDEKIKVITDMQSIFFDNKNVFDLESFREK